MPAAAKFDRPDRPLVFRGPTRRAGFAEHQPQQIVLRDGGFQNVLKVLHAGNKVKVLEKSEESCPSISLKRNEGIKCFLAFCFRMIEMFRQIGLGLSNFLAECPLVGNWGSRLYFLCSPDRQPGRFSSQKMGDYAMTKRFVAVLSTVSFLSPGRLVAFADRTRHRRPPDWLTDITEAQKIAAQENKDLAHQLHRLRLVRLVHSASGRSLRQTGLRESPRSLCDGHDGFPLG